MQGYLHHHHALFENASAAVRGVYRRSKALSATRDYHPCTVRASLVGSLALFADVSWVDCRPDGVRVPVIRIQRTAAGLGQAQGPRRRRKTPQSQPEEKVQRTEVEVNC